MTEQCVWVFMLHDNHDISKAYGNHTKIYHVTDYDINKGISDTKAMGGPKSNPAYDQIKPWTCIPVIHYLSN